MAEAILGRDAEDFLKTELGRYIVGRIKQERQSAIDELIVVSSRRPQRVQQLQNEILRCNLMETWLAELIICGREAERALDEARKD